MFYTHKVKTEIEKKFNLFQLICNELIEKDKKSNEKIITLREENKLLSERINTLNNDLEKTDIDIDSKLMLFRKEMLDEITGKFFDTLDKIFRTSKEISLIATLVNTNGSELGALKSQLLKPYIEAKHREERIAQGQEIVNKGQKIIETRNKLYEDLIVRQRKGENVSNLKTRIEVYDEIIKSLK